MNILFVSSEVEDIAKTGGLADVAKALPVAFNQMNHDVRIVTPLYKMAKLPTKVTTVLKDVEFHAGEIVYKYSVKQIELQGVTVYLIDYPPYFEREGIYSEGYEAFDDNGERYAFFSMAALHLAQLLKFKPDIIHCNDWHTGLIPFLLKRDWQENPYLKQAKTVLSVHNGAFQGVFELSRVPCILNSGSYPEDIQDGHINYLQMGIKYASKIVAVSPSYAKELQTDLGSHYMGHLFRARSSDMHGIINGCDYSQWDPQTDGMLPAKYTVDNMQGKAYCKAYLQQHSYLPVKSDIPLIGMICRITDQKGFAYLMPILEDILRHNVQIVLIGTGDPALVSQIQAISQNTETSFIFCTILV